MPFSISTFFCVGWPSSSTLSDPRRLPIVPSSITVHNSHAPSATRVPALRRPAILPGERGNAHARQRLAVQRENAIGSRHHHLAQIVGIDGLYLKDARVIRPRRAIGALD